MNKGGIFGGDLDSSSSEEEDQDTPNQMAQDGEVNTTVVTSMMNPNVKGIGTMDGKNFGVIPMSK